MVVAKVEALTPCPECDINYTRRDNMYKHLRKFHGVEPIPAGRRSYEGDGNPSWKGGVCSHWLWSTYNNMKKRCLTPTGQDYHRYGGRGIKVCSQWLEGFWNFVADLETLGPRPETWSLDRIDVNGDYELANVRWASPITQGTNRANVRLSEEDVRTIRNICDRGTMTRASLAKSYRVSKSLINAVYWRETWKHVSESPKILSSGVM